MTNSNLKKKFIESKSQSITSPWFDYKTDFGITEKDFDELVSIILESDLEEVEEDASPTRMLPLHAWRALGQLGNTKAIDPLLKALVDEKNEEAHYFNVELPKVIKLIGIESLDELRSFLNKDDISWFYKLVIIKSIILLAETKDGYEDNTLNLVVYVLKDYNNQDSSYISSILSIFPKSESLKIKELALELLRNNKIDFEIIGEEEFERFVG
jgi:hypothetical protein